MQNKPDPMRIAVLDNIAYATPGFQPPHRHHHGLLLRVAAWFLVAIVALAIIGGLSGCEAKPRVHGAPKAGDVIPLPAMEYHVLSPVDIARFCGNKHATGCTGTADGRTVIIGPAPQFIDDRATLVLGHEVLHVAIGNYH